MYVAQSRLPRLRVGPSASTTRPRRGRVMACDRGVAWRGVAWQVGSHRYPLPFHA